MTDDRLGICMRMVRVAINDAVLPEIAETAVAEAIVVTRGQVAAELVDGDLQDQFRRILSVCGAKARLQ